MENIIPPVDKEILQAELTYDKFVRKTHYGNREIYITNYHNSPNLCTELGRVREITFRDAGGGTGNACDLDWFDTCDTPFNQLIVWDPADKEIIGGYRFIHCAELPFNDNNEVLSPTGELFKFSEKFIHKYLPYSIELGRSFVRPEYQPSYDLRKGMFSLDNLWDGLGVIAAEYSKSALYFFGKMTNYTQYNHIARDILLYFLDKYFGDKNNLISPIYPIETYTNTDDYKDLFTSNNFQTDYKILHAKLKEYKEMIPPLFNAYMNLSSTMQVFGTSKNHEFGDVEETGILITIADINEAKKNRYIHSYIPRNIFKFKPGLKLKLTKINKKRKNRE